MASYRPAELPTGPEVSPAMNDPSPLAAIPATCPIEVTPSRVQMNPPVAMSAPTTIEPSSETSHAMPSVIRSKRMSPANAAGAPAASTRHDELMNLRIRTPYRDDRSVPGAQGGMPVIWDVSREA